MLRFDFQIFSKPDIGEGKYLFRYVVDGIFMLWVEKSETRLKVRFAYKFCGGVFIYEQLEKL